MNELLRVFLAAAVLVPMTLLPIVNPLGNAPIFVAATRGVEAQSSAMARRVAINCVFLLCGAILIGGYVLDFFGLSIAIVRVGGGLVVAATAWRLLNKQEPDTVRTSVAAAARTMSEGEIARRSFFPLSFPLTVGPGTIAATITLGARRPENLGHWFPVLAGAAAGIAVVGLLIFLTYRYSSRLMDLLGEVGAMVLLRLAAFILLCIGIEFVWSGWVELNHLM
jgi:multiple antibiotic resistance protein